VKRGVTPSNSYNLRRFASLRAFAKTDNQIKEKGFETASIIRRSCKKLSIGLIGHQPLHAQSSKAILFAADTIISSL